MVIDEDLWKMSQQIMEGHRQQLRAFDTWVLEGAKDPEGLKY